MRSVDYIGTSGKNVQQPRALGLYCILATDAHLGRAFDDMKAKEDTIWLHRYYHLTG